MDDAGIYRVVSIEAVLELRDINGYVAKICKYIFFIRRRKNMLREGLIVISLIQILS
jgi:hypothetical protein